MDLKIVVGLRKDPVGGNLLRAMILKPADPRCPGRRGLFSSVSKDEKVSSPGVAWRQEGRQAFSVKRTLLWILIPAAAIVLCGVLASLFAGRALVHGLEAAGPAFAGVAVAVESAEVSLLSGVCAIHGLRVGSPEGWRAETLFQADRIAVVVQPNSLWDELLVIDKIEMHAPQVTYETKLVGGSNLGDLLAELERRTGGRPAADSSGGEPRRFRIGELLIREAQLSARVAGVQVTIPLGDVHLTQLGSDGGITGAELAAEVTRSLLAGALEALAKRTGGDLINRGRDGLKQIESGTKEFLERLGGRK